MGVKLSGTLPDEDHNGLDLLHGDLVKHPERRHVVIAVISNARTTIDHERGGASKPTAGVLYIEPVRDADDIEVVTEVLDRMRAERKGSDTLDFDFGISVPDAGRADA